MAEKNFSGTEDKVQKMDKSKKKKTGSKQKSHARDFLNMDDKDIITQVVKDLDSANAYQTPYFAKFTEYYKMYKSFISKEDERKYGANLFIPYTFHAVETILPKILLAIFGERPYATVVPAKGGMDDQTSVEKAEKFSSLLDYYLEKKIKIVPKFAKVFRSELIYGTAITKQDWEFSERKRKKRRPKKIFGMELKSVMESFESNQVEKDHPDVKHIKIMDFFFDPAGEDIESCRFCGDIRYVDPYELKEKADSGVYRNVDAILKDVIDDDSSTSFVRQGYTSDMMDNAGMTLTEGGSKSRKQIELVEYWTNDVVVILANRKHIVYLNNNYYDHGKKPYARYVRTELEGEFYGIGAIEVIENLQKELNATRNQRIDNVSMIINSMWKVKNSSSITEDDLISRPNGIVGVDEMDELEPLEVPDVTSSAYNEEAIIKADIDNTLGIYDSVKGSNPARRETATTSTLLANAGSERFKLDVLVNAAGGVDDMLNQVLELIQQFIDDDVNVNLRNQDTSLMQNVVRPYDVMGDFEIVAVNSVIEPIINKEIRQNQITQLYSMMSNNPTVNQQEFTRRVFEAFEFKNLDSLMAQSQPAPQGTEGMDMALNPNGGGQVTNLADIIKQRANVQPMEEVQDGK